VSARCALLQESESGGATGPLARAGAVAPRPARRAAHALLQAIPTPRPRGVGLRSKGGNDMATRTTSTGASNIEYNLVAEMHELLQGNQALEQYIDDAKQAGDNEAERCFQQIHHQNQQYVQSLRGLLAKHITQQKAA
jgi:FtsZ-binding cell division protein ZapB